MAMPSSLTLLVAAAMLGLLIYRFAIARRTAEWQPFLIDLAALAAFTVFLHFLVGFPVPSNDVIGKGAPDEDLKLAALLGVCMLLGMLAQTFYQHFTLPRKIRVHKKLDWGLFFAPVCASPIVFIPLMVALQNANIDLKQLTIARLMIFFVAFQNGFFWKEHFDHQRKDIEEGKS